MTPTITSHGLDGLGEVMPVMACAFDPRFGEAWTAAQCTGVLAMPGAQLLIARAPHPVGFALIRTVIDEAELMLLAVAPEARRQGIGRALLQHTIDLATTTGVASYFLEVRSDNPAIVVYEKLGFRQVGIRHNYYRGSEASGRDALTYRLSLR